MKILFGVFDLGLGHATRSLPLIKELVKNNEVHVLSTRKPFKLLREFFGDKCKYHEVPSIVGFYNSRYFFKTNFVIKLPSIIYSLKKIREISREIINKEKFNIVISDCRYDVYDTPENSFLINHQLRFKAPFGSEWIFEKWLSKQMEKYKYIIVPDYEENNLSGRLSRDLKFFNKRKIKYIGILSQLNKKNVKKDIDYFFSLSGPDKTREDLQKKILLQINNLKGNIVIAGGNPDIRSVEKKEDVEIYSYLDKEQQENMMNRAKFVIVRGGYTTIMELVELEKNALLIPSPGQTEQEYLGEYLKEKGYFYSVSQNKLNLEEDIKKAKKFKGFNPPWKTKESVKKFMEVISE